jgi:hypothetical protein
LKEETGGDWYWFRKHLDEEVAELERQYKEAQQ